MLHLCQDIASCLIEDCYPLTKVDEQSRNVDIIQEAWKQAVLERDTHIERRMGSVQNGKGAKRLFNKDRMFGEIDMSNKDKTETAEDRTAHVKAERVKARQAERQAERKAERVKARREAKA